MKKAFALAIVAGSTAAAVAQLNQPVFVDPTTEIAVAGPGTGTYNSRVTPVWSNYRFPGLNAATVAGLYDFFDDIDFTGGPWAGQTGRIITQMSFGIGQAAQPGAQCTVLFSFYDARDIAAAGGGFTNATDMTAGVTPFATATYDFDSGYSGTAIYTGITAAFSVAVPDGTDRIYLRATICNRGDTATVWNGTANAFRWRIANDLTVGSGTTDVGWNAFNINTVPYFTGNPDPGRGINVASPTGTTQEHVNAAYPPSTGTPPTYGNARGMYLAISGDLVLPDPAGTIDLSADGTNCLPDAGMTLTPNLAANGVQYYKICLGNDATDGLNQFLDMDSIGSAGDTSIAIWSRPTGELQGSDAADGGNGGAGLLTFGIGRRNGTGDSTQYDGRDGELLAGQYIIGIATGNANFGPSYSASTTGAAGVARLNLKTNVNGTPAAPSVPPAIDGTTFDLGDISQIATAPPEADMDPGWVVWYKFQVCSDVSDDGDPNAQGTYLDFDFSTSFAGSDTQTFVFDSTGAAVFNDDDSGPGGFSQLSWGDVAPPRPAVGGDGLVFAGQNGALPAGTYYMALGLYQVVPSIDPRWHARSTSGSSLPAKFVPFFNGLSACSSCPTCAADFNQDGGVDGSDVEAFFTAWESGGGCGDVNLDGGVDGSDVESFYTVWEAGGC